MKDLNDLRFFATVVQEGSFSAAARALGVPKSRLSRRIALLEAELGARLLERSTRQVSPTESGHRVYAHARTVVAAADAASESVSLLQSEPRGLVRVSCPLGFQQVLARGLPPFLDRHPRLRLHIAITNRQVDLVADGIDIAIRVRPRLDTNPDLQVRRIGITSSILVASEALAERLGMPQTLDDLARFPILNIQDRPEASSWSLTDTHGTISIVSFQPRLSAADIRLIFDAALAGSGIALLPEVECAAAILENRLLRVLPEWSVPNGLAHVVFTSKTHMLPSVRAVLDFVTHSLGAVFSARPLPPTDVRPLSGEVVADLS